METEAFTIITTTNWSTIDPAIIEVTVPLVSRILTLIAGALSIIGSSTIIITYFAWKDLQTMSRQLLLCLSIADFIGASSLSYGVARNFMANTFDCKLQSMFSCFANCSTFLWTLIIAIYLYLTIVKANVDLANQLCPLYHVVGWGIPIGSVAVALIVDFDSLGFDHSNTTLGWCWINLHCTNPLLWMLLLGKMWEFVAAITLPVLCILMKVHIHKEQISGRNFEASYSSPQVVAIVAMDRKLTLLPLVFLALRCWGIVRFIAYLVHSRIGGNLVLMTIQGVANCSQGSANCILYFLMARTSRQRLLESLDCCSKSTGDRNRSRSKPLDESIPDILNRGLIASCRRCCCLSPCCHWEYERINTLDFYEDLAESSPLLHSRRFK